MLSWTLSLMNYNLTAPNHSEYFKKSASVNKMTMTINEIKNLIEAGIPDSKAIVSGAEGKYEATVISDQFEGMSMVKEHQLVYATVNQQIASGELHALTIKAFTSAEWEEKNPGE